MSANVIPFRTHPASGYLCEICEGPTYWFTLNRVTWGTCRRCRTRWIEGWNLFSEPEPPETEAEMREYKATTARIDATLARYREFRRVRRPTSDRAWRDLENCVSRCRARGVSEDILEFVVSDELPRTNERLDAYYEWLESRSAAAPDPDDAA